MASAGLEAYGAIRQGAVLITGGRLDWLGPEADLPAGLTVEHEVDCGGRWATPGLVDCHTHLVFGGNRAEEFERRLGGASYEDIAREGGGILSTVAATRSASEDALELEALRRVQTLLRRGVTTVEVKSGYGLDLESEMKMLRVGRRLGAATGLTVQTTLLGAHALPPGCGGDRAGYLRLVREEMIPLAAERGVADAVDAFCEGIAFTPEECAGVLEAARAEGMPVRLHADQLSDLGGAPAPPTTWSTRPRPACAPWLGRARWPCSSPGRRTSFATGTSHPLRPFAVTGFPWPWRRI